MIRHLPAARILGPALLLALAGPAIAQDAGAGENATQDARVATRDYAENDVVRVTTRAGFQSTIEFGEGERIENVAVGESAAWQVTPNRRADLLFIKPAMATAPVTNMTVVTDRHTYLFELHAAARATPVYLLRFAYAEEPPAPPELPPEAATPELIPVVQTRELPVNDFNFAWTMKGKRKLYPERVFDDGQSVYLAWAEGRALPAVLSIGPDGKSEGPVNFTADGRYLIVEGFHNRLVLRSGADVATIETGRQAPAEASMLAQTR